MDKLPVELLSIIIIFSKYNVNLFLTCKFLNIIIKYIPKDIHELICIKHNIYCTSLHRNWLNFKNIVHERYFELYRYTSIKF